MDYYAHRIFAAVIDGRVENTFICEDPSTAHWLVQQSYGESDNNFAIDVTMIPVQIGDTYENNTFYRTITDDQPKMVVEPLPTQSQQIETLNVNFDFLVDNAFDTACQIATIELLSL